MAHKHIKDQETPPTLDPGQRGTNVTLSGKLRELSLC